MDQFLVVMKGKHDTSCDGRRKNVRCSGQSRFSLDVSMLVASPERISQHFLTMRYPGRCQGSLCSADCEAEDISWYQQDIWCYQGALCNAAKSHMCHFHLQAPASLLGTPHISPGCLRALQPGKSEQGKVPRAFWAMTPRLIITLAEVAAVVQTCPLSRDSEWKCQSRGMASSKDAKLGVAFRGSYFHEGKSEKH